jgi:hypothetical protein
MKPNLVLFITMLCTSGHAYSDTQSLFAVPFEDCRKDFGTGNNTWYICPDITATIKSQGIFATDNIFIQSLPVKNTVALSFTCRTSQPVTADVSALDRAFLLRTSPADSWNTLEKSMSYSEAGTVDWTVSVKFRGSEFNSVKSDCAVKVLQNLAYAAIPALTEYAKVRAQIGKDLAAVVEPLSTVSSGSLSEVRSALDGAIKNINTVLSRPVDPIQKLLLTQTKTSLESMNSKISVACTATESLQCTSELDTTRTKVDELMTANSDELSSLKAFVDGEIKRVGESDQVYGATLKGILTEIDGPAT